MTPPGVCFSRATPFVKRRGRHVHRSPPGQSCFVDRTSRGKRPISALISNLRDAENFRSETARQLSVLFENEVKPRSCPDPPSRPLLVPDRTFSLAKGGS